MKRSVIDMGSNSLKMVNYAIDGGKFKPYHQESVKIRLSEGTENGSILDGYVSRAIGGLKLFKNYIEFEGIEKTAPITTSAIRDAQNQKEVLSRIAKETGYEFRVLSESQEAAYSYIGAARALHVDTAIFFDLGGGSLEIVYARDYRIARAISLPLGALRIRKTFCKNDTISNPEYDAMRDHIRGMLPTLKELGAKKGTRLIGAGGTLRAIARYDQEKSGYPLTKIHNYALSAGALSKLADDLGGRSIDEIALIESVGGGRADTVQTGSCVIYEMVQRFGAQEITVSAHGLREGVLALEMAGCADPTDSDIEMLIRQDAEGQRDLGHAGRMLEALHRMEAVPPDEDALIRGALEHIGLLSRFRDVDNVLYAVLDDDSALPHRDQLIVALSIVHSKKKRRAESLIPRYGSVLRPADRKTIRKTAAILYMYDICHKVGAEIDILQKGNTMVMAAIDASDAFPEFMFRQACERFERAFEISVQPEIRRRS